MRGGCPRSGVDDERHDHGADDDSSNDIGSDIHPDAHWHVLCYRVVGDEHIRHHRDEPSAVQLQRHEPGHTRVDDDAPGLGDAG